MKVVWLLGAGFSHPLGGPLMNQLFTSRLFARIEAQLGALAPPIALSWAREVHDHYATWDAHGDWRLDASRPWLNAEEFLELLETATDATLTSTAIRRLVVRTGSDENVLSARAADARRYLAAACHHFAPDASADLRRVEKWRPYRRWGNEVVASSDTIVSFNYDTVVERARGLDQLFVPSPWEPRIELAQAELLKLHGSVTWAYDNSAKSYRVLADPYEGIRDSATFLLGIPGPSKMHLSAQQTALLWEAAEKAIEAADVIVLIGYRFSETDDEAKRRLLGAVSRNKVVGLTLRIVLGPDTGGSDARRVEGMLDWALRGRGAVTPGQANGRAHKFSPGPPPGPAVLDVVPMWAQDFLSVVSREHLNHWPASGEQPPRQPG